MKIQELSYEQIVKDLLRLVQLHSPFICHIGLFGSVLNKPLSEVNDVDVLVLYKGITFSDLKEKIKNTPMLLKTYEAYLNVSYSKADKNPEDPAGYHFILMPIHDPCWNFLFRHDGDIDYLTEPFEIVNEQCKV